MFSVIFQVHPRPERFGLYLDLAKGLRPILERIDGFIDNERFESTRRPGWILSHSTWRDEKSVVRWRIVRKRHHPLRFVEVWGGRIIGPPHFRLGLAPRMRSHQAHAAKIRRSAPAR